MTSTRDEYVQGIKENLTHHPQKILQRSKGTMEMKCCSTVDKVFLFVYMHKLGVSAKKRKRVNLVLLQLQLWFITAALNIAHKKRRELRHLKNSMDHNTKNHSTIQYGHILLVLHFQQQCSSTTLEPFISLFATFFKSSLILWNHPSCLNCFWLYALVKSE